MQTEMLSLLRVFNSCGYFTREIFQFSLSAFLRFASYPTLVHQASYKIDQKGFLKLSKRLLTTYLVIFFAFSSIAGLFLFNPFGTKKTEAAWFNDNWSYRKAITLTVTSSSSDITNLDTLVTIDTTGITANLQTNCEDLRFTDVNGVILNYGIDSCTDNSATNKVWVRVNKVPKDTTTYTVYMYYGNAAAIAGSNSTLNGLYAGLKGYWAMNEASWGAVKDNSPTGADGTASGNAAITASGKYANGGAFDGTGDIITVNDNAALEIGANDFTFSTWLYLTSYPNAGSFGAAIYQKNSGSAVFSPLDIVIRNTSADPEHDIHVWMSTTGSSWNVLNDQDVGGGAELTLSAFHHVAFIRTSGVCKLYIDNVVTSATSAGVSCAGTLTDSIRNHVIGGNFQAPLSAGGIIGRYDDTRLYHRGLTSTDLTNLYTDPGNISTALNGVVVPSTSFASEEKGTSPISYWRFDDGQGTTSQDSTVNNNDLTLSGVSNPTWQTEDQCIAGKCNFYNGDGTGTAGSDMYTQTLTPYSQLTSGSISFWAKSTLANADQNIFSFSRLANTVATRLQFEYDNRTSGGSNLKVNLTADNTDQWAFTISASQFSTINEIDKWHQYTLVQNGTSPVLYIDGKLMNETFTVSTNKTKWLKALITDATSKSDLFTVGLYAANNSIFTSFKGYLDEFKIYPQSLSAAQIQANYNARSNPEGVSAVLGTNTQNMPSALSDGLVGYWKMDESSWTNNCSTTSVTDSSGNGNNGTSCPNAGGVSTLSTGKYGNAPNLDGTNDYINIADNNSLDLASSFTVSAWINPDTLPSSNRLRTILGKSGDGDLDTAGTQTNYYLSLFKSGSTDSIYFAFEDSSHADQAAIYAVTLTTGTWYHVTGVFDDGANTMTIFLNGVQVAQTTGITAQPATNAEPLDIGIANGATSFSIEDTFDGKIDETRVYNRALSANEVSQLYNWAPGPVGYWKMDEPSTGAASTTLLDASGRGNNLTTVAVTSYPVSVGGKYGKAIKFGPTDGSYARITNASQNGLAVTGPITLSAWVNPKSTGGGFSEYIMSKSHVALSGSTQLGYDFVLANNITPRILLSSDGTAAGQTVVSSGSNIPLQTWTHLSAVYDGSTVKIYVNGVQTVSTAYSSGIFNNDGDFRIHGAQYDGGGGNLSSNNDKTIDDVKVYNYARTQAQIVEDMNAGHPAPGSPVGTPLGYWKLDEGYGTTANNYGNDGSVIIGTLTNISSPATSTSGWTNNAKFNKGLIFEGAAGSSNDYVAAGSDSSIDNLTANPMSLSAWIYPLSAGENSIGVIMSKNGNSTSPSSGWIWQMVSTGNIKFSVDGSTDLVVTSTGNPITLNAWNHVVLSWDGTFTDATKVHIYVNGREVSYGTQTNGASIVSDASSNLLFGNVNTAGLTATFDGTMDELKIYNQALTVNQIKLDMNRSSSEVLGAMGTSSTAGNDNASTTTAQSAANEYCVPGDSATCTGPVAEWKLDEGSGTSANDSSGNAKTGTLTNGPAWANTKMNKGVSFDGTDDYITMGSLGQSDDLIFSYSLWVQTTQTGTDKWLFGEGSQSSSNQRVAGIINENGVAKVTFINSGAVTFSVTGTKTINDGKWHYITYTADGTNIYLYTDGVLEGQTAASGTTNVTLSSIGASVRAASGASVTRFANAVIDQVRVFSYARTPAQIAWDYNKGGPVGWWKMDECQGTVINDMSGNSLTGTWSGSGSSNTAVGTCNSGNSAHAWFDGATGKKNYALGFDGGDDLVTVSANSILSLSTYSTGFWINGDNAIDGNANETAFVKYTGSLKEANYNFTWDHTNASFRKTCEHTTSGDVYVAAQISSTLSTGTWYYITCTFDGTTLKAYLNGNLSGSAAVGAPNTGSGPLYIGASFWNSLTDYFPGKIDDLKVFNYPLTATQIKTLYNDGATRYGPVTGAP